jgi:hypothetical protein
MNVRLSVTRGPGRVSAPGVRIAAQPDIQATWVDALGLVAFFGHGPEGRCRFIMSVAAERDQTGGDERSVGDRRVRAVSK